MGRVQFTNFDSDGNPVTDQLVITFEGERHEIEVASTGSAMVPDDVETFLVESPDYAVESYDNE